MCVCVYSGRLFGVKGRRMVVEIIIPILAVLFLVYAVVKSIKVVKEKQVMVSFWCFINE